MPSPTYRFGMTFESEKIKLEFYFWDKLVNKMEVAKGSHLKLVPKMAYKWLYYVCLSLLLTRISIMNNFIIGVIHKKTQPNNMTQIYIIVVSISLNLTQVMFILPLVLYLHSVIRESPWWQKNMLINT